MAASSASTRGQLLVYLLVPLCALWLLSSAVTYYLAARFANVAYDRALQDTTNTLAAQVHIVDQHATLTLPEVAWDILGYDNSDKVYFQVLDTDGRVIAGDQELPLPPVRLRDSLQTFFFDAAIHGEPVRVASVYLPYSTGSTNGRPLVQVAETLVKRRHLAGEILWGVALFAVVSILLAAASVWIGVGRALAPLTRLRAAITSRSHRDLSPVVTGNAPSEVQPLLHALNDLLARLAQVLTAQQRFVADAAHQLRTPLAGIKTQADFARRQTDPSALHHALQQISTSVDRTTHLAHQLLSLARAEAAPAQAAVERVDLNALTREVTAEWVPRAVERDVDLGFEGDGGPVWVLGNTLLLREMLANLLDNALRYAPPGGKVTTQVSDEPEPLLTVEDNGPGIPEDQRAQVFEPFYRLPGGPSDGSGLGLAIVAEIAANHGGRAWIGDSPPAQGTRVHVALPPPVEAMPWPNP